MSVSGRVSVSGDAANAACAETVCHSLGNRTHATTLSILDHHRQPAAAAAGVADSDGQSASLADSNSPTQCINYISKYTAMKRKG